MCLFLAFTPFTLAANTWYVDGIHGNNSYTCMAPTTPCKTIGHAIALASSGDSVMVAKGLYKENVTISFNLRVIGAGANATTIDGRGVNRVVAVFSSKAHVTLSKLTLQNGAITDATGEGGGIYNAGNNDHQQVHRY
jgi:hypothetical protein